LYLSVTVPSPAVIETAPSFHPVLHQGSVRARHPAPQPAGDGKHAGQQPKE
jgi:hypothetical protein